MSLQLSVEAVEKTVDRFCMALAHVCLLGMAAITAIDVAYRYVAGHSLAIDEVSSEFLMPGLIFLVAANLYSRGGFVRITGFTEALPALVQRLILWVSDMATCVLFALITFELTRRTIESYRFNEYSDSPLGYMLFPSIAIVAFGSFLLTLRTFKAVVTMQHPIDRPEDFEL